MKTAEVRKLHKDITQLAYAAFTLDLYATGKRLCNCAEHLRQLLVLTDTASSRPAEKRAL